MKNITHVKAKNINKKYIFGVLMTRPGFRESDFLAALPNK